MTAAPRDGGGNPGAAAVTVRPRKVLRVAWACAVLSVVFFTVIAVLLRNSPTGVFFRLADQIAMVLMGLFVAGGVLLLARPRVRADADGIEVRNILVTRHVPWDQVRGVAFPDGASWARLDLPDDEYLSILAIQAVDGAYAVDGIRAVRALYAAASPDGAQATSEQS
ncbi:PH domain-containing protein [Pseudonocardia bannensis]|uniref:PH domain-containing protein n=1 Tax=Pseudonocardia bannensis TaxID=630973 RepID=A0A848DE06_9PSEU|nr:PH domain-containing protein [Pseudonocardia bannensis]NMH90888.1 PH domain-containing protein [Pseudonocardia bannensis]